VSLLRMSAIRLLRSVRVSVSIAYGPTDGNPRRRRPTTSSKLHCGKSYTLAAPKATKMFAFSSPRADELSMMLLEVTMPYFVNSRGPAVLKRGPYETEDEANRKRDELRMDSLYEGQEIFVEYQALTESRQRQTPSKPFRKKSRPRGSRSSSRGGGRSSGGGGSVTPGQKRRSKRRPGRRSSRRS
jgi:uncharacterized membrane protein YgcG